MGGKAVRIAALTALALAVGAPVAEATSVYWTGDYRTGNVVRVVSAPDEPNDLVITTSDGDAYGVRVVDVRDRAASLDDGGETVTPGECSGDFYYCEVPCRIEAPDHARCVIEDGFGSRPRTLDPLDGEWPYFRSTAVDAAGGYDRVLVPRGLHNSHGVGIGGGDGGNYYTIGSRGSVDASHGDDVRFLPGATGGSVTVWGGGVTVHAIDGAEQSISCWHQGAPPKLYLDPFDRLSNGPYCPDPVTPPKLPAG